MISRSLQVLWNKVNWMVGAVHLTPWYMTYVSPQAQPPTAKPPVEVGSQAVCPFWFCLRSLTNKPASGWVVISRQSTSLTLQRGEAVNYLDAPHLMGCIYIFIFFLPFSHSAKCTAHTTWHSPCLLSFTATAKWNLSGE